MNSHFKNVEAQRHPSPHRSSGMSSGIYTKGLSHDDDGPPSRELRQHQESSQAQDAELELKRTVYRASLRKVWGVLKKMGCPDDELLDLAHKTYAIAFSNWDKFRGESRRETWVIGIALNVARNYLRRDDTGRLETFTDDQLTEVTEWGTPRRSPEEEAHWRQRVQLLRQAMKQLRSDQRELLELVLIQQLSITEAASRLGVSQRQAYTLKDGGVSQLTSILRRQL